ncbi:DUF3862 domain-containing protein [Beggiatoa leptomitoformis]|uniref:DUF3862 domain-containing protein n=1 Tax=Beggiatoa leptomitoformis TaxID=288004 RepID=A0A2N9YEN6_9GAMM|nr:DUF3862 domain-containing protein [Beggiatoa leptomitoformis]ALG68694.1 DUF3862 domain-containing protein [Beggiatoa leptomitoformis]AUI68953.1 DUF3862 domain-containing protein [Beggiatoa leptomitoformis]
MMYKLLAMITLTLFLTACGSPINQANYDKVTDDMLYSEVVKLLGEPTHKNSSGMNVGSIDLSGTDAEWQEGGLTINIVFVNDKVKIKRIKK